MEKNVKKIFSGAVILAAGTFIAKLLGAIYRIPLTRIIGVEGLGLYQMIFPVYTLLLEFSGIAVPNALSKIISSYDGNANGERYARKVLKTGVTFFALLGAFLSFITALFSGVIAKAQGNISAKNLYVAISPSVFLVSLICCFRGYFQGRMNMFPTALSQVIEQAVKLIAGLSFSAIFMPDIIAASTAGALAVTLSELSAFIYLFFKYRKTVKTLPRIKISVDKTDYRVTLKTILYYAVPIAFTGVLLPLSKVADSFIIINGIAAYREDATALYGIFSGVAVTIVGLPVALCYGIATVVVPAVSRECAIKSGERDSTRGTVAYKSLMLTAAVSGAGATACYFFAPLIVEILYGYLAADYKEIAVLLLKTVSPCVFLLSILQTLNAVLIGKGKPKLPLLGLFFGVTLKIIIESLVVSDPKINIYGAGYGAIACYFVADLVNFICVIYISAKEKVSESAIKSNGYTRYKSGQKIYR